MKQLYILFFIIIYGSFVHAQETTITLNEPLSGDQTFIASESIRLLPGFHYSAATGSEFVAKINEKIISPVVYEPSPTPGSSRTLNTSLEVGSIPGSYSVSPNGALNYSIPIEVPAGINGMVPSLSINYSNQAGNGLLGLGWNLGGLSYITRGTKSLYQDDEINSITYTDADAYYLNGQRLILTDEDDVYTTEVFSLNKIIKIGDEPDYMFEVHDPSGRIMYFNQKVLSSNGSAIKFWALSKIVDLDGNEIGFHYIENENELRIDYIDYAGNIIDFYYVERDDKNFFYTAGEISNRSLLLSKIEVLIGNNLYRKYDFTYQKDLYSLLYEIALSDGNGNQVNSTIVDWNLHENEINSNEVTLNEYASFNYPGDFNGDGVQDILVRNYTNDGTVKVYGDIDAHIMNKTNLDFDKYNLSHGGVERVHIMDRDDDGKDEIYILNVTESLISTQPAIYDFTYTYQCYEFGTTSFIRTTSLDFNFVERSSIRFTPELINGDFNGDGEIDILIFQTSSYSGSQYRHRLAYSEFSSDGGTLASFTPIIGTELIRVINQNGNKKADILCNTLGIMEYNKSSQTFDVISTENPEVYSYPGVNFYDYGLTADFNGDGITDICPSTIFMNYEDDPNLTFNIQYGTGDGYVEKEGPFNVNVPTHVLNHREMLTVNDFNSDGKSDILRIYFEVNREEDETKEQVYFTPIPHAKLYISTGNNFTMYDADDIFEMVTFNTKTIYQKPSDVLGINTNDFEIVHFYDNLNLVAEKSPIKTIQDFDLDGLGDFIVKDDKEHKHYLVNFFSQKPGYVSAITNGMNVQTNVNYATLYDTDVYSKDGAGETSEIRNFISPLYVVKSVELSDDNNQTFARNTYFYTNAKLHNEYGMLGFTKFKTTNTFTNIQSETTFEFLGDLSSARILRNDVSLTTGSGISSVSNSNESDVINFANGHKSINFTTTESVNTDILTSTVVTTTYSNFNATNNQPQNIEIQYGADMIVTKDITFSPTTSPWLPVRIFREDVTQNHVDDIYDYNTVTLYSYVTGHPHQLDRKTYHAGTDKEFYEEYSYEDFGTPGQIYMNSNLRYKQYNFSADNKFVVSSNTNGTFEVIYDYSMDGNLLSQEDHNNISVTNTFGAFNSIGTSTHDDGTVTTISKVFSSNGPAGTAYKISSTTSGAGTTTEYYNCRGQLLRKSYPAPLGETFNEDFEYNIDGKLHVHYEPYTDRQHFSTTYGYDPYGRVNSVTTRFGETTTTYSGKSVTVTSPDGWTTKTYDDYGQLDEVQDDGGSITYSYKSIGLVSAINYGSHVVTFDYDQAGNRILLNDPNRGAITSEYDEYGQLTEQTDAKGNITTYTYDDFGRLLTESCGTETNTYNYETDGTLSSIDGANTSISYQYDAMKRCTTKTETINGQNFVTSYTFGDYSMLETTTYPSGYSVQNVYDANGILYELQHNGSAIWELTGLNNDGQITNYEYGNGVPTSMVYDNYGRLDTKHAGSFFGWDYNFDPSTGNLLQRRNTKNNRTETFLYDDLNRMTSYYNGTVTYDDNGNITSKTSAGYYDYNLTVRPNAVVSIEDGSNDDVIEGVGAVATDPGIPTVISTLPQDISYNWFNKPIQIEQGLHKYLFTFGPDKQRKIMEYQNNDVLQKVKYYVGNYEKVELESGGYKEYTYISAPSGLVGVNVRETDGSESFYYLHTDYLGSIMSITDNTGTLRYAYHYDAWGRKMSAVDWTTPANGGFIDRGYTGHEHLWNIDIINMNGRLYDPIVGRMLNPDNYLMPENTQGLNMYSYVLNNPMKYTDPTGWRPAPTMFDREGAGGAGDIAPRRYDFSGANARMNAMYLQGQLRDFQIEFVNNGIDLIDNILFSSFNLSFNFSSGEMSFDYTLSNPYGSMFSDNSDITGPGRGYGMSFQDPPKDVAQSSGNSDGASPYPFISGAFAAGDELMFSKNFNTWLGKDFKLRSQNWGGNGATGGKFKYAKSTGKVIGLIGKGVSVVGMYSSYDQWKSGDITNAVFYGDMASGLFGIFGGIYGASWEIGWELGKNYGPSTWFNKPPESRVVEYMKQNGLYD